MSKSPLTIAALKPSSPSFARYRGTAVMPTFARSAMMSSANAACCALPSSNTKSSVAVLQSLAAAVEASAARQITSPRAIVDMIRYNRVAPMV